MWKLFLDNPFDPPGCLRLSPRGVFGCSGRLFYPPCGASLLWLRRECWALRGACAAAVVALGVAGLLRLTWETIGKGVP